MDIYLGLKILLYSNKKSLKFILCGIKFMPELYSFFLSVVQD